MKVYSHARGSGSSITSGRTLRKLARFRDAVVDNDVWPRVSPIFSAMMKAMMVVLPPGANGTMRVIGRVG
jgi:hypothetical protein